MSHNQLKLTGQKFGRLTVIEPSHKDIRGTLWWRCKCKCGKEAIVRGPSLKNRSTKSCGCLGKENMAAYVEKCRLPKGEAARNAVLGSHKSGAKKRNIEQALTDEQIIALHKENCHYCGCPPSNIMSPKDYNGSYTYNGIDRIDNTKGYTITNTVSCCYICNKAKGTLSVEDFMGWIDNLITYKANKGIQNEL